jgi:hypothetical protein
MKEHILPAMSPFLTKNVSPSVRLILLRITAVSHQGDDSRICPFWLMMAEIPVLAHRAMSRLVSIALSEE